MRKALMGIILGVLLLTTVGCGGKTNNSTTTSSNISTPIKQTIEQYFNQYFDAEKVDVGNTLNYTKMSNNILASNEDTQLIETFRETELQQKKLFKVGMKSYLYKINYGKCTVNGDETTVTLTLDLDFQIQDAPNNLKSAIHGVNYSFTLKNNGSNWLITQMDSDLEEFVSFKNKIQKTMQQNPTLSKTEAIYQVGCSRKSELQTLYSASLNSASASNTQVSSPSTVVPQNNVTDNSFINQSVYVSCKQYTYKPECAVKYAETYYDVYTGNKSKAIFYVINVDCTNFVSQCVWAGYTGFDPTKVSTAQNYISKKIGMMYPDWYAGTGGGSSSWENVKGFFSYMITGKTVGPKVDSYKSGPNGADSRLDKSSILPSEIKVGDVMQLYYDEEKGYDHSIIITGKEEGTDKYEKVYYSGHTNSRLNYPLIYIYNDRTYTGWRKLTPAATCYLKTN